MLVEGVAGDKNALGFFGLAYYEQNQDRLKLSRSTAARGCVAPTPETIQDGTYAPLSRPLYVYVKADSLTRPEVQEFLRFSLARPPRWPRKLATSLRRPILHRRPGQARSCDRRHRHAGQPAGRGELPDA